jgi:S1-C subfamily serine protease
MKRDLPLIVTGLLVATLFSWNLSVMLPGAGSVETIAPVQAMAETSPVALMQVPLAEGEPRDNTPASAVDDLLALAEAEEQLLIHLYERVSPSVVYINVTLANGFGGGTGSGFVLDNQGHIVTNNHVVEGASRILVHFVDDTTVEAELVGADPDNDLAVIQVDVPASLLMPVELGDSATLRVGQRAIAVGNPFGFEQTMTTGIISALGRVVLQDSGFSLPKLIQTDAAINPGNSGGPLLDSQGRVIGVTTLIFSSSGSSAGVGFAVPVDTVKRVVPALIATGRFADPWLGITGLSLDAEVAELLALPVTRGVLVRDVIPGGPSDKAALRASDQVIEVEGALLSVGGDIIVALDGAAVQDMDDLATRLSEAAVGQTVAVTIVRDGEEQRIEVTLEERPAR